jgi:hypothetical protein
MTTVYQTSEAKVGTTGRRTLSADKAWWYNGARWVSAITDDGLWQWEGTRWVTTVDLEGKRPEDLATTLTLLAEECYREAGIILADRAQEWEADLEIRPLVSEAREAGLKLSRIDDELTGNDGAPGRGLLGRRGVTIDDRRQLGIEKDALGKEYRMLTTRLGRNAPQPSLKEADDKLASARLLEDRAELLTAGLAEVDEAERMRADAAVAAQKELAAAENARLKALEDARKAVADEESAHASAVAEARLQLRNVLAPGAGELRGGVGPLRLHATSLDTPAGRLPAASSTAYADNALGLWANHRAVLNDLVLLDSAEGQSFRDALADRSNDLFLLIISRTGTHLWPCPQGHENATKRFAAVVNEHSREAKRASDERDAGARKAEENLDRTFRDRSRIEAAEQNLARVEADPSLLGAIDEARHRLHQARADTPELNRARQKVLELANRLVAPPEALQTDSATS